MARVQARRGHHARVDGGVLLSQPRQCAQPLRRFFSRDGDHAVWSRVVGFLWWDQANDVGALVREWRGLGGCGLQ